jgi:hypothetical protein
VKLRRPDLYDALEIGDQLAQLSAWAAALRECAEEVLRGDFTIRAEVKILIEEEALRLRLGERSELAEWRYRTAIEEANEAFRSKDYHRVVRILVQHESRLTPAERLKLEYAKRKSDKGSTGTA